MEVIVPGFEHIKQEYADEKDFGTMYSDLLNGDRDKHLRYNIHDGLLFKGTKLCLSATSIREHVVRELPSVGCSGHLGRDKTPALVDDHYYCPLMKLNVISICERCCTCLLDKGNKRLQCYINHCHFLMPHGKISAWTSC